ncbi:MAG TPA: hypothetical protein VMB85_06690, partial [Bryobacteraceae bacterium]|nr:hypothetical protein [Bryobacteraceae bacterium]
MRKHMCLAGSLTIFAVALPAQSQQPAGDSAAANVAPSGNFFERFFKAYYDDWTSPASNEPQPPYRGDPAPVSGPPFPFSAWPYGGSVTIGQPWTQSGPLMQALWSGSHGDWWKH